MCEVYQKLSSVIDDIGQLIFDKNDITLILNFENNTDIDYYHTNIIKDIPHTINTGGNQLIFNFTNSIDLIGKLPEISNITKQLYMFLQNEETLPKCIVYKRHENAIIPHKTRFSDVGYDVYIIKSHKIINKNTTLYDTGIALQIPFGYYVEIVPRSSLSKTGYMLSNSIGIIDRSYRGNLYISLTKTSEDSIDLSKEFPFKCCQLILRKQYYMDLVTDIDEENNFHMTSRNDGGFGSTNIKN